MVWVKNSLILRENIFIEGFLNLMFFAMKLALPTGRRFDRILKKCPSEFKSFIFAIRIWPGQ